MGLSTVCDCGISWSYMYKLDFSLFGFFAHVANKTPKMQVMEALLTGLADT